MRMIRMPMLPMMILAMTMLLLLLLLLMVFTCRTSSNVLHFVVELNVDGEVTFGEKKFSNMEKFMIHLQGQPMVGSTEAGTVVFLSTPYPGVVDEPSIYTRLSVHHEGGTFPLKMPMTPDRVYSLAGKSGYMVKQGGRVKSWKKRWFVLERNELKYYNNREDTKPIDTLLISRCSKVQQDISQNKSNCFSLVFPERTYYMQTTTSEERQQWMELIQFKMVRPRFRFYDAALSLDLLQLPYFPHITRGMFHFLQTRPCGVYGGACYPKNSVHV
uniref:Dual adapter for phosphotyrosine and 3-phosphotyrosine and 3-phosphoinositide-like isoform X2 n=1 Tax=Petromyzon marinus TaxID=7757 RepID=A0AAJ7TYR6_PETMA|nr:dual adapter for phosphotyrosine and 3-phosphotyrosine and 3-phosphoinositide-like isoform X2 [Petromyzon marinus]